MDEKGSWEKLTLCCLRRQLANALLYCCRCHRLPLPHGGGIHGRTATDGNDGRGTAGGGCAVGTDRRKVPCPLAACAYGPSNRGLALSSSGLAPCAMVRAVVGKSAPAGCALNGWNVGGERRCEAQRLRFSDKKGRGKTHLMQPTSAASERIAWRFAWSMLWRRNPQ